jgi:hypothetical protein
MSTRTPAEDRQSRSTRSAIETVRATDLSIAVLNVLWEDAEFVLSRAVRGERLPPPLTMTPTSLRPVPDTVARLENGYALRRIPAATCSPDSSVDRGRWLRSCGSVVSRGPPSTFGRSAHGKREAHLCARSRNSSLRALILVVRDPFGICWIGEERWA